MRGGRIAPAPHAMGREEGRELEFTRGEYFGAICWELKFKRWAADVDWNTRFHLPSGFSLGAHSTRRQGKFPAWSWCLEVNAPLGEPNRLYLHGWKWWAIVGLPSFRMETWPEENGGMLRHVRKLHIDGCVKHPLLNHKNENGEWVPNDRPERTHWGWLTVSRDRE